MLEPMDSFFSSRIKGYDEHMLRDIEGAAEFYPFTTSLLPADQNCRILDLGCGTGLELEYYYGSGGAASLTCIDLSREMLDALVSKFPNKDIKTFCASYFDVPLGEDIYDAVVSVESLHHFSEETKQSLYRKVHEALRDKGIFVITDYFVFSEEEELNMAEEALRLRAEQGIPDGVLIHADTPFTIQHEISVLLEGGFSRAGALKSWGSTSVILAEK